MATSHDGEFKEYREYEPGHPYEPYIATYSGTGFIDPELALKAMQLGMSPGEMIKDATTGTFLGNTNNKQMERGYKVLKLNELAKELGLPSSRGTKTKDYLRMVIDAIEDYGLRFVQFLQLVDVLYVIVQKVEHGQQPIRHVTLPPEEFRPEEEIAQHYEAKDPMVDQQISESVAPPEEREPVTEEPPELEQVKKRDHLKKTMTKEKLPWQK